MSVAITAKHPSSVPGMAEKRQRKCPRNFPYSVQSDDHTGGSAALVSAHSPQSSPIRVCASSEDGPRSRTSNTPGPYTASHWTRTRVVRRQAPASNSPRPRFLRESNSVFQWSCCDHVEGYQNWATHFLLPRTAQSGRADRTDPKIPFI